jgi:hypothetical protein
VGATLRAVPERPTDLDGRVRLVWKAASWLQRGKVDPALGLLETLAGPSLDEWSAAVLRGTRLLRTAEAELGLAVELGRRGDPEAAARHADAAVRAFADALGGVTLERSHRSGSMVLGLPDPWRHVLDAFQEHLDRARQEALGDVAGGRVAAVLQFTRPGA